MLKILQARLQQYVNHEPPDVQAGFEAWMFKQKNIYFCFIDYAKDFACVDHNKLENSSRDGNTRPSYLSPRNLFVGQEATVRTRHGTTDWFQIGKEVHQGCIWLPCLFKLYAE